MKRKKIYEDCLSDKLYIKMSKKNVDLISYNIIHLFSKVQVSQKKIKFLSLPKCVTKKDMFAGLFYTERSYIKICKCVAGMKFQHQEYLLRLSHIYSPLMS